MLVARAAGRAFVSVLFVSCLACARRAGPRARRQVFYFAPLVSYVGRPGGRARSRFFAFSFGSRLCASRGPAGSTPSFRIRGARNLCRAPGRPGWLSIRFVSVRFSCVLARRPRGLGPEFSIFPPRVGSAGPAGRARTAVGSGSTVTVGGVSTVTLPGVSTVTLPGVSTVTLPDALAQAAGS